MDIVTQTGGANCPRCQAAMSADDQFCGSCGYRRDSAAQGAVTGLPSLGRLGSSKKLGHLGAAQHAKQIKSARNAILLVAILILLISVLAYVGFEHEVESARSNPRMVVNEDVVKQTRIILSVSIALGVVFLGLWWWAKSNPFAACLTALILYATNFIVGLAIAAKNGQAGYNFLGIFIPIMIMLILFRGVKSGLAYKREMERARFNPS